MSSRTHSPLPSDKPKLGFIKLVLVMFVIILLATLAITQLGDSQGTMDFNYDGFG